MDLRSALTGKIGMNYKLKILLLLSMIWSVFCTCKKYPENDHIYLSSIKNRLDKHDWYFSRLLVDGNDSTIVHLNRFTTSTSNEPRDLHFQIKKFAFNSEGSTLVFYIPIATSGPYSIQFSLRNHKKNVYLGTSSIATMAGTFKNFFIDNDIEWQIEKLTKTEFVLEKTINNLKYRLEFKS
jgi:hypothetical protein